MVIDTDSHLSGDTDTKYQDLQGQVTCQKKSCITIVVFLTLVIALVFVGGLLTKIKLDEHKNLLIGKDGNFTCYKNSNCLFITLSWDFPIGTIVQWVDYDLGDQSRAVWDRYEEYGWLECNGQTITKGKLKGKKTPNLTKIATNLTNEAFESNEVKLIYMMKCWAKNKYIKLDEEEEVVEGEG